MPEKAGLLDCLRGLGTTVAADMLTPAQILTLRLGLLFAQLWSGASPLPTDNLLSLQRDDRWIDESGDAVDMPRQPPLALKAGDTTNGRSHAKKKQQALCFYERETITR
ncbi:MAG TPA: hypothetical protein VK699_19795 [Terriglobales bacterium]|nr:hypothetical protein [Terriglobales bacterium]